MYRNHEVTCPTCKKTFEVYWLDNIECPKCGFDKFYWDSYNYELEDGYIEEEWYIGIDL